MLAMREDVRQIDLQCRLTHWSVLFLAWAFFLLVLALLAPVSDGHSVFDGFPDIMSRFGVLALYVGATWAFGSSVIMWAVVFGVTRRQRWAVPLCRRAVCVHAFMVLTLTAMCSLWFVCSLWQSMCGPGRGAGAVMLPFISAFVLVKALKPSLRALGYVSRVKETVAHGSEESPFEGGEAEYSGEGLPRGTVRRSVGNALLILVLFLIFCVGARSVDEFRGLKAKDIQRIRVYEDDRSTLLLQTSDAVELAKFAEAVKDATVFHPNHPGYAESCFVVVDARVPFAFTAHRLTGTLNVVVVNFEDTEAGSCPYAGELTSRGLLIWLAGHGCFK